MKTKRQKLLDSNSLDTIIGWVCSDCGKIANHYTCLKKFLAPSIKPCFDVSTYHKGTCHFCHRETMITQTRDFFYPDFSLIPKSVEKKLRELPISK